MGDVSSEWYPHSDRKIITLLLSGRSSNEKSFMQQISGSKTLFLIRLVYESVLLIALAKGVIQPIPGAVYRWFLPSQSICCLTVQDDRCIPINLLLSAQTESERYNCILLNWTKDHLIHSSSRYRSPVDSYAVAARAEVGIL